MKGLSITIDCQRDKFVESDPGNAHRFRWKVSIDDQMYGYQTILTTHPCLLFDEIEYIFDTAKVKMIDYIKTEREKYKKERTNA